jgi:integrase/transposase-like protein
MSEEAPKSVSIVEAKSGPVCPECGSNKLYKDGLRYLADDQPRQRYLCRMCSYRFSWPRHEPLQKTSKQNLKTGIAYNVNCQVCASEGEAKNLAKAVVALMETDGKTTAGLAGATETKQADVKGAVIQLMWWLKKQGYSDATVKTRIKILKQLTKTCDIFNPEDVKKAIAMRETWSEGHKQVAVHAYNSFAKMLGLKWEPPRYKHVKSLPFIPLESELDALISGCSRKVDASLQLLKETGMRIGEAWRLKWTDIDEEQNVIRCRAEKGGEPRVFKVSGKLIAMLKALPKVNEHVFGGSSLSGHRWSFDRQKKRLAAKLQNPRLLSITFHTFRHWKATMEYHKTKDILYVKQLLGHRNINSTLVYTQLVKFEGDEYYSATAKTTEEAKQLVEVGFEYVCTSPENIMLFRKRK